MKKFYVVNTEDMLLAKTLDTKAETIGLDAEMTVLKTEKDVKKFVEKGGWKIDALTTLYNNLSGASVKKLKSKAEAVKSLVKAFKELDKSFEEPEEDKTEKKRTTGAKELLREIFSKTGAALTLDQLVEETGKPKKHVTDAMAYLKNPNYCGAKGEVHIIRGDDKKYRLAK